MFVERKGRDMNWYQSVSVVLALGLYVPLGVQILQGKVVQNLATFILWGLLDTIAGTSLYVQGGNYGLPFAYVAGCTFIIACILKKRTYNWTSFETKVSFLVLLSIVAWMVSGPYMATIFSTTGVVLAGVPQVKDSWRNPKQSPMLLYIGYAFANLLSTIGGKSWTVEERLYSFACFLLVLVVVGATSRKYTLAYRRMVDDARELWSLD